MEYNILFSSMAIYSLENKELIAETQDEAWIEMSDPESNVTQKNYANHS